MIFVEFNVWVSGRYRNILVRSRRKNGLFLISVRVGCDTFLNFNNSIIIAARCPCAGAIYSYSTGLVNISGDTSISNNNAGDNGGEKTPIQAGSSRGVNGIRRRQSLVEVVNCHRDSTGAVQ